jgi:hypothetical protein
MPYERIVQWVAGPTAIVAGWASTWLINHAGVITTAGFSKSELAKGIADAITFTVGAGVTYAAHHKWLTNLAKYWHEVPAGALPSDTAIETAIDNELQKVLPSGTKVESGVAPDREPPATPPPPAQSAPPPPPPRKR